MRFIAFLDLYAGRILLAVIGVLLLAWLVSCADGTVQRGSAQDQAAGAASAASTARSDADSASDEAARLAALAKAAEDKAKDAETKAKDDPTPARIRAAEEAIQAAVEARLQASVARALADDRAARADAAAERAVKAAKDARDERTAELAAADERERLTRAWWIAAGASFLATVGAAVLVGVRAPLRWLLLPAAVLAGAWALYAFAAWAAWIAAVVAGTLLLALLAAVVWTLRHLARVEWPDAVDSLRRAMPDAANAYNTVSVVRQAKPVRAVTDWLLRGGA
jgi:hypothetical protein